MVHMSLQSCLCSSMVMARHAQKVPMYCFIRTLSPPPRIFQTLILSASLLSVVFPADSTNRMGACMTAS